MRESDASGRAASPLAAAGAQGTARPTHVPNGLRELVLDAENRFNVLLAEA
jgi:hypothetical protein